MLFSAIMLTMNDEENTVENPITDEADDIVEFVYNADGEEDLKATLKKLRKDIKEAKAKENEYLTALQRERADFINYKKDETERLRATRTYAEENFILDLLPALDSYDMAFSNREAWEKVDKNWRIGVEYIHQQILKVLADYNVSPIEARVGDAFDPALHQSLETIENSDREKESTIATVVQSGYRLGERILRPAGVKVFEVKMIQ